MGLRKEIERTTIYLGKLGDPARDAYEAWLNKNPSGSFSDHIRRLIISEHYDSPSFKKARLKRLINLQSFIFDQNRERAAKLKRIDREIQELRGVKDEIF